MRLITPRGEPHPPSYVRNEMSALTERAKLCAMSSEGAASNAVNMTQAIALSGADLAFRALNSAAGTTGSKDAPTILLDLATDLGAVPSSPRNGSSVARSLNSVESTSGASDGPIDPGVTGINIQSGADLTYRALQSAASDSATPSRDACALLQDAYDQV